MVYSPFENLSLILKYQGGEGGWVFKIFGVRNMHKKKEPLIYIMYHVLVYHFFIFNFVFVQGGRSVFVHFLGN
jgi:hypothetical protein